MTEHTASQLLWVQFHLPDMHSLFHGDILFMTVFYLHLSTELWEKETYTNIQSVIKCHFK